MLAKMTDVLPALAFGGLAAPRAKTYYGFSPTVTDGWTKERRQQAFALGYGLAPDVFARALEEADAHTLDALLTAALKNYYGNFDADDVARKVGFACCDDVAWLATLFCIWEDRGKVTLEQRFGHDMRKVLSNALGGKYKIHDGNFDVNQSFLRWSKITALLMMLSETVYALKPIAKVPEAKLWSTAVNLFKMLVKNIENTVHLNEHRCFIHQAFARLDPSLKSSEA